MFLDQFQVAPREALNNRPLVFVISDVYKATNLGVIAVGGKVEGGVISVGDKVQLMPVGEVCSVKGIRLHGQTVEYASAGDNADLGLLGIDPTHIRYEIKKQFTSYSACSIGNLLCDPENPIPVASRFKAQIITFALQRPILKGQTTEMHYQSLNEPAVITHLISVTDKKTGTVKKNPRALGEQTQAEVEIKLQRPMCLERYSEFKPLGRFTLREGGRTIAAGIITDLLQ